MVLCTGYYHHMIKSSLFLHSKASNSEMKLPNSFKDFFVVVLLVLTLFLFVNMYVQTNNVINTNEHVHGGEAHDLELEIPGSPPTTRI